MHDVVWREPTDSGIQRLAIQNIDVLFEDAFGSDAVRQTQPTNTVSRSDQRRGQITSEKPGHPRNQDSHVVQQTVVMSKQTVATDSTLPSSETLGVTGVQIQETADVLEGNPQTDVPIAPGRVLELPELESNPVAL